MGLSFLVNDERELSSIANKILSYSKSNIFFFAIPGSSPSTFIKYLCSL